MSGAAVEREAARVIVLNSSGHVLLQEMEADSGRCWILPGGGLRPGESHRQAALRELAEEVGLRLVQVGPWVWTRTAEFTFRGIPYRQRERFYLIRSEVFEFDHTGWEPIEREVVLGHRWWPIEAIAAAEETFWPRGLADLLRPLALGMLPQAPREIGD